MEAARTGIFVVISCMEAGYREDDRETWPTIGNRKKVLALFGLASPRRIEQLAGRLMQTGFLASRVPARDRRARLLIPAARMMEHDEDWMMTSYAPLDVWFGQADSALPHRRDKTFQDRYGVGSGKGG